MMQLNISEINNLDKRYKTNLINSLSGFKSANLIGTKDNKGNENLTIISSAVHIGADPATMGFIFRPNIVPRHTYENILETKSFTVNHVSSSFFEKAHQTSARYEREQSEFEEVGLTPEYIEPIFAPFVLESPLKIGLSLVEHYDIKFNPTHFIIGKIEYIQCDKESIDSEGRLNLEGYDGVCVSGLDSYHKTTLLKTLPYAKSK